MRTPSGLGSILAVHMPSSAIVNENRPRYLRKLQARFGNQRQDKAAALHSDQRCLEVVGERHRRCKGAELKQSDDCGAGHHREV